VVAVAQPAREGALLLVASCRATEQKFRRKSV